MKFGLTMPGGALRGRKSLSSYCSTRPAYARRPNKLGRCGDRRRSRLGKGRAIRAPAELSCQHLSVWSLIAGSRRDPDRNRYGAAVSV